MWRLIAWGLRGGVVTAPAAALEGPAPPGTKGRPALDAARCTGAGDCARACPTGAIALGRPSQEREGAAARPFRLDYGACIFCGRCVVACGPGALRLTEDYALAARGRDDVVLRAWVAAGITAERTEGETEEGERTEGE